MSKTLKKIDQAQYLALLVRAKVLESDGHGEKVLGLPDVTLVKVFLRKRWLSTAILFPSARRFVRDARQLADREILTVRVLYAVYCPSVARHLVTYQPLPGITLRQTLNAAGRESFALLDTFACFVSSLHQKGVYFRSLHFGNVIVPPDGGQLGLIDIADMSLYSGPLPVRLRARNFGHMLRYREDRASLYEFGWDNFLDGYLKAAHLRPRDAQQLLARADKVLDRWPALG
jgi:hypothetical protein